MLETLIWVTVLVCAILAGVAYSRARGPFHLARTRLFQNHPEASPGEC